LDDIAFARNFSTQVLDSLLGGTKACFFIGSRFDMADTYFLFVRFFRVFMVASAACWWASRLEYPEPEPTTVPLIADALAGRWVSACR